MSNPDKAKKKSLNTLTAHRPRVYTWNEINDAFYDGLILSPPCRLDIVRHAETVYNDKGLISGQSDTSLTNAGRDQAKLVRPMLSENYCLIYCSCLSRARATMEIALSEHRYREDMVRYDFRLNERSLGVLEGQLERYIPEYEHGDLDYSPVDGDSYRLVIQCCASFLMDLHKEVTAIESGGHVLVFTHMGPMRVFEAMFRPVSDPGVMMAAAFENVHVKKYVWTRITLPAFC